MDLLELLSIILPVIAFCGVSTIIIINIYLKIRSKFPVSVNCWFCNKWLKVSFNLQNSFDCPFCEQYNGFNADGDYNKPIPAQHDELMNKAVPLNEKQTTASENGLCNVCNNNQRLKIHQLAAFSPIDESNYDEEVERYQEQLERSYRLCPQCEKTVNHTLQKQKSILLGLRLSNLRSQGLSLLNLSFLNGGNGNTAKRTIFINAVKYLSFILAIVQLIEITRKVDFSNVYQKSLPKNLLPYLAIVDSFIVFMFNIISTITEYFSHLYSFTNNSLFTYIQRNLVDLNIFTNFIKLYASIIMKMEACVLVSCMGTLLELLVVNFGNNVKRIDFIRCVAWVFNFLIAYARLLRVATGNQIPEFIQMFLCCVLIIFKSSNGSEVIKLARTATASKSEPISNDLTKPNYEATVEKSPSFTNQDSPKLNTLSPLSASTYFESGFACFKSPDSHIFGQKAIFENPLTTSHFKFSPNYRSPCTDDSFSSRKSVFNDPLNVSDETIKLNDSLNGSWEYQEKRLDFELGLELDKLHLGTYPKYTNGEEPSVFKVSGSRPKPVLSPPKLHNVTQSSWVAGGYWKNPNDNVGTYNTFSNLSRSSSQSSGFGSQTSSQNLNNIDVFNSLPPSRNNSICGEFDKFSVFSEPAYHYSAKNGSCQNRVYPVLQCDQPVYIYPRNPPENNSFRPNSSNSVISQNNSGFISTKNNLDNEHNLFRPSSNNSVTSQNNVAFVSSKSNLHIENNSFRPRCNSSMLYPNASLMTTKNNLDIDNSIRPNSNSALTQSNLQSASFISTKSNLNNYLSQSFDKSIPPVNSSIYKSNEGFVKGSLLQKWRDQNSLRPTNANI